jgi:hypothetical protein
MRRNSPLAPDCSFSLAGALPVKFQLIERMDPGPKEDSHETNRPRVTTDGKELQKTDNHDANRHFTLTYDTRIPAEMQATAQDRSKKRGLARSRNDKSH